MAPEILARRRWRMRAAETSQSVLILLWYSAMRDRDASVFAFATCEHRAADATTV